MYTVLTSFALGSAALWSSAAACQYTEHPSAVMSANDALRVPIATAGAGGQNECAATAEAFGISMASIVPDEKRGSECVLFGGQPASTCGPKFEAVAGAKTLLNITGCDAAAVKAVGDGALLLAGSGAMGPVGSGSTTATKVINTAAVGKAVHSDLSFVTEEECLVACATYIKGCTHVTTVVGKAKMVQCSFHGSPTKGVQYQGANTYYSIIPNPQLATRSLGATSNQLGTPPTVAAPQTPAVAPVITPVPPVEPEVAAAAPAPVAGPTGAVEELVYTPPGMCPSPTITDLPAGKHQEFLEPPDESIAIYADVLGDNGKFPMPYYEIVNGGQYCVAKGSTNPKVIFGGMFFWETGDGECVLPPINAAGEGCCEVFMWQPNTGGNYYENCSMKMVIQPDGVYYFETEMPGDESLVGWGPDPKPHIHFDLMCTGCAAGHAVVDGDYHYWNKLYPEELCKKTNCGDQGPVHQATKLAVGGQTLYKYDFILPGTIRTQNQA